MRHVGLRALWAPFCLSVAAVAAPACDDGWQDDYVPPDCRPDDPCCYGDCSCEATGTCEVDQPVVISPVTPKPITGGTLLVSKTRPLAIASDPDRDRIVVTDLDELAVLFELPTPKDAVPGRAIELPDSRVFVVLREAGQIVGFDPATGAESAVLTAVCPAPRGIDVGAPAADGTPTLLVACAGGELVTVLAGPQPTVISTIVLDPDLRDVVVAGDRIYVSHFRSADIDVLNATGERLGRARPRGYTTETSTPASFEARVAWRMVPRPEGGVWVVHQNAKTSLVTPPVEGASYYGDIECATGVVHTAVTAFDRDGAILTETSAGTLVGMTLPVDVAASADGDLVAVISAANYSVYETTAPELLSLDGCANAMSSAVIPDGRMLPAYGEVVAIAYTGDDRVVVQYREPAAIEVFARLTGIPAGTILLGGETRTDTAHLMFHSNPDFGFTGVACASCHPEGRDDAHVWSFESGPRRTQSLAGDIRETAPFHWSGDLADMGALMDEVFVKRMGGNAQSDARKQAIAAYIGTFPAAPRAAVTDPPAVERGRAIFESAEADCTSCHTGARLTVQGSYDVGKGGAFQVPSLLALGTRAPFMHDGCAATLADRFIPACGGGDLHGKTSHLGETEITDLVAYLASL